MLTTVGTLDPPLGRVRLHVAWLLSAAVGTNTSHVNNELAELGTVNVLLVSRKHYARGGPSNCSLGKGPSQGAFNCRRGVLKSDAGERCTNSGVVDLKPPAWGRRTNDSLGRLQIICWGRRRGVTILFIQTICRGKGLQTLCWGGVQIMCGGTGRTKSPQEAFKSYDRGERPLKFKCQGGL